MRLSYNIRLLIILLSIHAIGLSVVHSKDTETGQKRETPGRYLSEQNDVSNKKNQIDNKMNMGGSSKVIAYYFHGTRRCRTCKKIEALTEKAIKSCFQSELEKGVLEFSSMNVDKQQNRHFIEDYKLYTKSVVIVKIIGGKQERWKNLERIWQLVHNEEAFIDYISEEVRAYF